MNCLTCGEDGACKNGTTAESKPCAGNQKSCALGFMKFENQFIEMKGCSPIPAQVTGCVDISLDGVSSKVTLHYHLSATEQFLTGQGR